MTNAPERIYNWQHNQMSIARHYGGLTYQGHTYTIAPHEKGQPLVRADVIKREAKEARKLQALTNVHAGKRRRMTESYSRSGGPAQSAASSSA